MIETAKQIRIKRIIQHIKKNQNCTTKEITHAVSSEERSITERTIQQDLKYLREHWKDGEITSIKGCHRVKLYDGLSKKGIEEQAKIFLKLALENLENLSDLSDEYQTLVKKLNLEKLQNPFYIKPEEYQALNTDKEEIKDLHSAINNDTNIAFTFKGKDYHVEPYRLVNFDGIWYLYGRDIEEKEESDHKTWILKEIDNVEVFHGETHDTPDEAIDEDLEDAYSAHFVVDKSFEVKLKVAAEVADIFRQKNHLPRQHSTIQKDGSLSVTSIISTYADIDPEIKSWLPHIKILEPVEYREKFKKELKKYLEKV